jgi:hypothetical protein
VVVGFRLTAKSIGVPLGEYRRLLSRYLVSQRRWLLALVGVVFGGIGVRLLNPWIAARFLDRATSADAVSQGLLSGWPCYSAWSPSSTRC